MTLFQQQKLYSDGCGVKKIMSVEWNLEETGRGPYAGIHPEDLTNST
jgi:hypothetical protein